MRNPVILKYSEDDILEIVTEYMAEKHKFEEFRSKSIILGTPGIDLRLVAIIAELDDDSIKNINLEELELTVGYNGEHSQIKTMNKKDLLELRTQLKNLKEV